MVKEEKIIKSPGKINLTEKLRKNPWMAATIILAAVSIVLLVLYSQNNLTGKVVSEEEASEKLLEYINTLADSEVTYVSSKDLGTLYEIQVSYQGQAMPLYVSKDGQYWTSILQPMQQESATSQSSSGEIQKSDKPIVEAFVFSYCPYGLQFEKALLPVYNLLKNQADIRLVFIGAMHGEYEEVESLRQICIQKEYGKDKLFAYLDKFAADTKIGDCEDDMSCSLPFVKAIFTQLSISESKIDSCMDGEGKTLYAQDQARAQSLGVAGSPGFVINGQEVQVSRSPAAILGAVCSSFNNAPVECTQQLSSEQASPWFGSSSSSSSTSSAAQC